MKNKDALMAKRKEFAQNLKTALDAKDDNGIIQAFDNYANEIQQNLLDTANEIQATADSTILARRGIRQLTSVEQKFYNNVIEAMKAENPKQALSGLDLTIPQTVIDTVLTDVENSHPLLAAMNIRNTYGSVKWIYSKNNAKLATWGKITDAIITEVSESIEEIEFGTCKLSAFIPVPKDLLDLGASYIDAYVRILLGDALASGLEYGYVKGSGKNMPIGFVKDLKGAVTEGEYADKTAVSLKSIDVKSYCSAIANLAVTDDGRPRAISSVDLIVNPKDYIQKIIPATTVLATDGTYKGEIFPFPTKVYQSEMVDEGTAILGSLKNYLACLSTGKEGKLDYSDQYQFLEDNRVYLIKLYGTGRPMGNTDFLKLDISKLEALKINVTLESQTTETT